jgi:hypothetical protein
LDKALDIAYQDVINQFDLAWGVKGLVMTQSNSMVTWKVRRHMGLISRVPLGLRLLYQGGCILVPFNTINSSICAKKKEYLHR